MAKITVKGLDKVKKKLSRNLKTSLTKALRNADLRKEIGKQVASDTKNKTFGIAEDSTQKRRAYLERFNQTDLKYSRSKINITFTGALLKDLANNVKANTITNSFEIKNSDKKHPGYLYKPKKGRRKRTKRNKFSQISDWVIDKGYDYLKLEKKTLNKIRQLIKNKLLDLFKKVDN